jgi:hypothetical protein
MCGNVEFRDETSSLTVGGHNNNLESTTLTSQCFPIRNISHYTSPITGKGEQITPYSLSRNLTAMDLFQQGFIIESIPSILSEN